MCGIIAYSGFPSMLTPSTYGKSWQPPAILPSVLVQLRSSSLLEATNGDDHNDTQAPSAACRSGFGAGVREMARKLSGELKGQICQISAQRVHKEACVSPHPSWFKWCSFLQLRVTPRLINTQYNVAYWHSFVNKAHFVRFATQKKRLLSKYYFSLTV